MDNNAQFSPQSVTTSGDKKVLIAHPFLHTYGGAEQTVRTLAHKIFPLADIFTLSNDQKIIEQLQLDKRMITSFLKNDVIKPFYRSLFWAYPAAIDTYNFENYDVIFSSSYGFTHGLITNPDQLHISYVYSPMRILWTEYYSLNDYIKSPIIRPFVKYLIGNVRNWDKDAAFRPDYLIAISKEVQQRIKSFWNRDSVIIYPPVKVHEFTPKTNLKKEEYYVTMSRLVKYKKIDVIIEAFKRIGKKLIIVGEGPEEKYLKTLAKGYSNIEFTGFIDPQIRVDLLQKAKGYIFAAHEDFGISVVEAQAAGTPVLAFAKGGVLETVVKDKTGIFFNEQTPDALVSSFKDFELRIDQNSFVQNILYAQAQRFSEERFIGELNTFYKNTLLEYEKKGPPVF